MKGHITIRTHGTDMLGIIFYDYGALEGKLYCFNLKGGSPRSAPASPSDQLFCCCCD